MAKPPFVILWLPELEMAMPAAEKLIYAGIKSFCSNGKEIKDLSTREISERIGIDHTTVIRNLPGLLSQKIVEIVGQKSRSGGKVNIYKVVQVAPLSGASNTTKSSLGGANSSLGGADVGIKHTPIKVKSNINTKENNLLQNNTTGILKKNKEVGFSDEKRKKIWDAVNSWSAEKLAQQRGSK